jgi:hypothetical protein
MTRVTNWRYIVGWESQLACVLLLLFSGALTDGLPKAGPDRFFSGAIYAVALVLAGLAPGRGVVVRGDRLTVRSWVRTHRLPLESITDVLSPAYDGLLVRGSPTRFVQMLALQDVNGATLIVTGVLGSPRTIRRLRRKLLAAHFSQHGHT